jgi:pyruvate formate lyase activating enzyme
VEGGVEQSEVRLKWDPEACDVCGHCAEACASGAIQWIGRTSKAGEVMARVLRDVAFYGGGGGITLTGGEPMLQPKFTHALLRLARSEYIHTTMETCGHVPWTAFEQVLPQLDLILYDLKHMDSDAHRRGTGVCNELILENARRLAGWLKVRGRWGVGGGMIVRVPLIPGFNVHVCGSTSVENIRHTVRFALELGVREMHLLPYHRLGQPKYRSLGRSYAGGKPRLLAEGEVEAIADIVRSCGLRVRVGG